MPTHALGTEGDAAFAAVVADLFLGVCATVLGNLAKLFDGVGFF